MKPDQKNPDSAAAEQPELKRWHPQPEPAEPGEPKTFAKPIKADDNPASAAERKINAPHAKPADQPLADHEKHDQLSHKADQSEDRQEALIDEGVEETFPASDPVSVKRIT